MPNMKSISSSHNKFFQIQQHNNLTPAIAEKKRKKKKKKTDCPLKGKCLQINVIYQATVTTETTTETYVGLATNFKERYRNHRTSFRHLNRRNQTELSKYVWTLQDDKKSLKIKRTVLKKCKPYSNISKICNLCRYETFIIICKKRAV